MSCESPLTDNPLAAPFEFPGGRRGVLLLHGFTGTPAQMRPLGEALHGGGYTVLCPLLPGHGTHVADMERYRWSDWLHAASDAFNRLAARCDDIAVAGLSMGGVLALLLAEELPVSAAVSIASPMRLKNRFAYLSSVVAPFMPRKAWPKKPETANGGAGSQYYVGYSATPVRKVPDLLRLVRIAEQGLHKIKCPLLIVQPALDGAVRQESAEIIYRGAVNAARKEILRLENSRHVCTVEPEFEKLYKAIIKLLSEKD